MPLTIKITGPSPGASAILKGLDDSTTLKALQAKIAETTGVAPSAQRLKTGFPPKEVDLSAGGALITALGVPSGSTVIVSQKTAQEMGTAAASSASSSSAASSNPAVQQLVDMGFPIPVATKALELSNNDVEAALELCIGGLVTEEALGTPAPPPSSSFSAASMTTSGTSASGSTGRVMVRRVIDADNSCLFNAIGYCMDKDRKIGAKLRKIIADTVRNRPDVYSEAVLGRSPTEYSTWILNPATWGGEIELFILSQYYGAEIVAIEIKSQHSYIYGEGKNYNRRIYVLYDGVHYDALAAAAGSASAPESMDLTQFPAGDEESKRQALALAAQLKQSHQFVDLAGFKLRCMICNKGLQGQEDALAHARATRHQNFGEIK